MRNVATHIALLLIVASAAFNLGSVLSDRSGSPPHLSKDLPPTIEDPPRITPTVDLSPRDVVRIQLTALASCQHDPHSLSQVFAFASPENRQVTGPIDRFAKMLLSPKFRPLVEHQHLVIGEPVVHDRLAAVTVTLMDHDGGFHAYRFYLSRQSTPPYEDCWMTYGVTTDPRWSPEPTAGWQA